LIPIVANVAALLMRDAYAPLLHVSRGAGERVDLAGLSARLCSRVDIPSGLNQFALIVRVCCAVFFLLEVFVVRLLGHGLSYIVYPSNLVDALCVAFNAICVGYTVYKDLIPTGFEETSGILRLQSLSVRRSRSVER
jgi:hypothetical protein